MSMGPSRSTSKRCSSIPTNHRILYKLAKAYQKKEAWDKVASTLARATQVAPKFANYWYLRGYALEEQAAKKTTSWEEAKEPFKKCIEADPNYRRLLPRARLHEPLDRQRARRARPTTRRPSSTSRRASLLRPPRRSVLQLGLHRSGRPGFERGARLPATKGEKKIFDVHVLLVEGLPDQGSDQRHGHRARGREEGCGRRAPGDSASTWARPTR